MMAVVRKSPPPVRNPLTPLRGLKPGMRVRVFAVWTDAGEQRLPGVPGTVIRILGDRRRGHVELDARIDMPVVHAERTGPKARWVVVDSRDCSSLRRTR